MTPKEALRSSRGERLANTSLLGADRSEPGAAARRRAARARHPAVGVLPARHAAAEPPDRGPDPRDERPAPLLPRARRRAAGVLAAPRRPPRAHRLRADPSRLRDLDGGEARSRPRVDRRPLRPALPAHPVDDGAPNPAPNLALNLQPRVLEIQVAPHPVGDIAADQPGAAELHDGGALGIEQLPPQPLVRPRLLLDRAVRFLVEARREAIATEVVEPAHALGGVVAHPFLR